MNHKLFDLNLLRVFHRIMVDRKLSTAAENLGITQPAVSNALKRMRDLMGDDLFIRSSRGMMPTLLAMQLAEPISYSLSTIDGALNHPIEFDPTTAQHTFSLSSTDIGEAYLLPRLLAETAAVAPHISFTTAHRSPEALREAMEDGSVDLSIGLLPQLQGNFFHRRLLRQTYVLCMRKEHPLAHKQHWTIDDYIEQRHVAVISAGTGHGAIDTLLARKGIVRNIRLVIPHFMAIGPILKGTDLIATLPETFVRLMEQPYGLVSSSPPVDIPFVNIDVFWHRRVHRDPANIWLRNILYKLFTT